MYAPPRGLRHAVDTRIATSAMLVRAFRRLKLVEAAGVEPASEIAVSQECPCSVRFRMFSPAGLRTDKMADKLVRLISPSAARTEPLKPAY